MNKSYLPVITPIIIFLVGLGFLFYTYYKNISNKPSALSVTSKYNEAQISFRSNDLGKTPVEVTEIRPGRGEIVIATNNHTLKKEIILTQEALTVVSADVGVSDIFSGNLVIWYDKSSKSEAELFISSSPDKAGVKINDKYIGETPLTVSEAEIKNNTGEYTILVEKEGYESQKLTVKLEQGYILNVSSNLFLKPIPQEVERVSSTNFYVLYGMSSELLKGQPNGDWAKAVAYWIDTRGAALFGSETIDYFDYFVDSDGKLYSGKGELLDASTVNLSEEPGNALVIGYLNDKNNDLSEVAQQTLSSITGSVVAVGEDVYEVIETGIGYLNVRKTPDVSGELAGQLQVGDTVEVLEEQNGWSKIEFEGEEAWVSSTYLQKVEVDEEAEAEVDTEESEE